MNESLEKGRLFRIHWPNQPAFLLHFQRLKYRFELVEIT